MTGTTVAVLFTITTSWFGNTFASEVMRFPTLADCEVARIELIKEVPATKLFCIDKVLVK
jgi:hypothetical protein